jgi:hypothetical protein
MIASVKVVNELEADIVTLLPRGKKFGVVVERCSAIVYSMCLFLVGAIEISSL